jgi:hypothetical protein
MGDMLGCGSTCHGCQGELQEKGNKNGTGRPADRFCVYWILSTAMISILTKYDMFAFHQSPPFGQSGLPSENNGQFGSSLNVAQEGQVFQRY